MCFEIRCRTTLLHLTPNFFKCFSKECALLARFLTAYRTDPISLLVLSCQAWPRMPHRSADHNAPHKPRKAPGHIPPNKRQQQPCPGVYNNSWSPPLTDSNPFWPLTISQRTLQIRYRFPPPIRRRSRPEVLLDATMHCW